MARPLPDLLGDVHAAASDAIDYARDLEVDGLEALHENDRMRYRAIKNAFLELCEALKGLPPERLSSYPEVDWRGMTGLRDVVAHGYFKLDMELLHPVLKQELPDLLTAVERMRAELSPPDASSPEAPERP